MKINMIPDINTNLLLSGVIFEIFLPEKMPAVKKIYWQIAVASGNKKLLKPRIDKPIPEPIESIDKAKPMQNASGSSIVFELFKSFIFNKII